MRPASHAKRSDYASYHEVRKAGKKVRYLLEFFEPLLPKKQLKSAKELKRIQKRFGALNDVVASLELLRGKRDIFPDDVSAANALAALEKERKRRVRAAAKLRNLGNRKRRRENSREWRWPIRHFAKSDCRIGLASCHAVARAYGNTAFPLHVDH
jgi:CHAD domain-containing protein